MLEQSDIALCRLKPVPVAHDGLLGNPIERLSEHDPAIGTPVGDVRIPGFPDRRNKTRR
ncbi:MAG TPA: hypothetical protein VGU64_06530 [Terriglobales bacterium]|nr:hypothetical protein [Terriglobales bacterium]